jgi:hypothetical protein
MLELEEKEWFEQLLEKRGLTNEGLAGSTQDLLCCVLVWGPRNLPFFMLLAVPCYPPHSLLGLSIAYPLWGTL